jgi:hypothetical protein
MPMEATVGDVIGKPVFFTNVPAMRLEKMAATVLSNSGSSNKVQKTGFEFKYP